jgi:divalent metal cation (Fe/Co/Zn/Cd) transporter
VRRSVAGLMDAALPADRVASIRSVLARHEQQGVQFHALRTRQAAARSFVEMHVLVPGAWSVQQGHDLLEQIEHDIRAALPDAVVSTHLEPLEDPASHADQWLDRRH